MRAVLITFDDVPTDEDENIEAGILDTIKYIMAVGDSVGVYVAMTTPYPEADTFTDQKFMSNFQAKAIVASRDIRVASQNILGAEKNLSQLQGLGRGGLTDSQGENVFQATAHLSSDKRRGKRLRILNISILGRFCVTTYLLRSLFVGDATVTSMIGTSIRSLPITKRMTPP